MAPIAALLGESSGVRVAAIVVMPENLRL